MPFKHSNELHKKVHSDPKFESDEEFEMKKEEKDKFQNQALSEQCDVLDVMQKTIRKLANSLKDGIRTSKTHRESFTKTLREEIEQNIGLVPGLQEDYTYQYTEEDDVVEVEVGPKNDCPKISQLCFNQEEKKI